LQLGNDVFEFLDELTNVRPSNGFDRSTLDNQFGLIQFTSVALYSVHFAK